ncbi:MAG: AraC family transcriptional regulator [Propionibacteriaceae bacterium]|nr:AraC family transcriptional regulator [Propionibacteriaceae bacterium]
MDPLSDFLAQPRARDAFLLRVIMGRPWRLSVADEAPLSIVPILKGRAWYSADRAPAIQLTAGDVIVVRAPTSYVLSSAPDAAGGALIGMGQACSGPDGRDLSAPLTNGVRAWGNTVNGDDEMLVGSYRSDSEMGRLMLQALPPSFVVHDPAPQMVHLLAQEISRDDWGQNSVLDRLLDVLLVATLRAWLNTRDGQSANLLAAPRDGAVRAVTEAIHAHPEAEWSVDTLAERAGISRAALSRRFASVVGVSPMQYLTRWRLAIGADLLDRTDSTIAAIAHQVGYGSPFSFSAAFKRRYGLSPQVFRQRPQAQLANKAVLAAHDRGRQGPGTSST